MRIRAMKRYLIPITIILVLTAGLVISCAPGFQTFDKYGISFKVAKELKLEEYMFSIENQTFRRGTASYEQGWVMSAEKNFVFLWVPTVPKFTYEEVKVSILSTPNIFESASGTFQARIIGNLTTEEIAGFEVTFAEMQFTQPGWEAPGITAVWYSPNSQRTMQVVLIHKRPETEVKRFIRSFSDAPPTPEQITATQLKSYVEKALPIMMRHVETTETTNQANRAFLKVYSSGNEKEILEAFTDYKNTLEWAVNRVDSTLLDFKKLLPPSEVRTYHSLMIEGLTKEQYGLTKQLSYYSSVLLYGFGDDKELDDGNALLLEAQKIWLQAQYEFQELLKKAGE